MVEAGAILLALLNLIVVILEDRRATRPQRERAEKEQALHDDLADTNRALVEGDAAALAQQFERERLEAAKRLVPGNGRLGTVRVLDGSADREQPHP